jgi:hypothetical protein
MLVYKKKFYTKPTVISLHTVYYIRCWSHREQRQIFLIMLQVYLLQRKFLPSRFLTPSVSFGLTIQIFRLRWIKYRHTNTKRARLPRNVCFCLFICSLFFSKLFHIFGPELGWWYNISLERIFTFQHPLFYFKYSPTIFNRPRVLFTYSMRRICPRVLEILHSVLLQLC